MHYDLWATVFASSMLTGASLVVLLTAKRAKEPLAILIGIVSIGITVWAATNLLTEYGRFDTGVYAGILAAAAAVGGYGLASSLLPLHLAKEPVLEPITQFEAAPGSPVTVLLACPLEPEHYTPSAVAADLSEMIAAGLPEAGMGITPFLYAAQKARYRAAGGRSPSIRQATALAEHVEQALDHTTVGPVELVACSGHDTLDAAVTRAAARGCDRIVVVTLSIGESYQIDRAKSRVDLLRPQTAGIRVTYTPPLWGSESLAEDLAQRIWVGRDEPAETGVALVLHGQPEARERTHGVFDVQENAFANRVRMFLSEFGIPDANSRLCYMDWRDPDVTETIRHLAALGCTRVIVTPACFPFESVTTILDLQVAVRQARVDAHVLIMQPWGGEDAIARVIVDLVREAAADLGANDLRAGSSARGPSARDNAPS